MQRQVVITGLGLVSSLGTGKEIFWQSLLEGRSGIRRLSRFDPSPYDCQVAGEIPDEAYKDLIPTKQLRRMSYVTQLATAATKMALIDADVKAPWSNPHAAGVILGTGAASYRESLEQQSLLLERGLKAVNPYMGVAGLSINTIAAELAVTAKTQGPAFSVAGSCASSLYAINVAADMIRGGSLDVCVTGGAESLISPLAFATMCRFRDLATHNEYPEQASRPFDQDHNGLVPSEGSGILILEERRHAERRGARIYAKILGYALGCDAHDTFAMEHTGESAALTLKEALRRSSLTAAEVEWINAHGSSCPDWDRKEARVIHQALGNQASSIPLSATKSVMGHAFGAAAAFQVASSVLAMQHGYLLPTINLDTPDPECGDLNYIRRAQSFTPQTCLINNFGYGGLNSFLLLAKE